MRNLDQADVALGSVASDRYGRDARGMSAMPPIATRLVRRGSAPLCAKSGCEQSQQRDLLFDQLIGAGEHGRGDVEAKRLGGDQIDDEIESSRLLDRDVIRPRSA